MHLLQSKHQKPLTRQTATSRPGKPLRPESPAYLEGLRGGCALLVRQIHQLFQVVGPALSLEVMTLGSTLTKNVATRVSL